MTEPWDDDLKKMKNAVPVPPDFLKRVRAQIAQSTIVSHKERVQQDGAGGVWWDRWMDFLGQNPFPVAAATAIVIFGGVAFFWKPDPPPPSTASSPLASAKISLHDSSAEVIVRIELADEDSSILAPAGSMAGGEEPPILDNAGTTAASLSHKHQSQMGGTMIPPVSPVLPVPVIRSTNSLEETVRIVEQLAKYFSGVLIDSKLADSRRDLNEDHSVQKTVLVEIAPDQKGTFLAALSNSILEGGVVLPHTWRTGESGVIVSKEPPPGRPERRQFKIHIGMSPAKK